MPPVHGRSDCYLSPSPRNTTGVTEEALKEFSMMFK